jgi:hypothetical protein
MTRIKAVAAIPLRFYSFHTRSLFCRAEFALRAAAVPATLGGGAAAQCLAGSLRCATRTLITIKRMGGHAISPCTCVGWPRAGSLLGRSGCRPLGTATQ